MKEQTIHAEEIDVDRIAGAEINTHTKESKKADSFMGLCDSMRESGQLVRIRVRPNADGYEVIDGHRRLAAAKAIGMATVLCDVVEGLADEDAMVQTATANSQREDDDPIAWAELVEALRAKGMTYRSIAAKIGRNEGFVTRRARLANLTKAWRKVLKGSGASVKMMETIAAYEPNVQDAVLNDDLDGSLPTWGDWEGTVMSHFTRRHRLIEEAQFDTEKCATCPYNTACHSLLFPDLEGGARCTNSECYSRKWNEITDNRIFDLREKKVKIVEVHNKWDIPDTYNMTKTKTTKNKVPYVYKDGPLKYIVWSRAKSVAKAPDAMTEAEKKAAKLIKQAHREWTANRRSGYNRIRETFGDKDKLERMLTEAVNTEAFREWFVRKQLGRYGTYIFDDMCQDVFDFAGAAALKDYGVEITDAEANALTSADPAKAAEEGKEA